MERLTFEVHDGGMFVKETDVKTYEVEDEVMHTGNAIRKLAEYEDLEEQGRLLKFPCVVGDTVFHIWYANGIPYKVQEQKIRTYGQAALLVESGKLGKTVFLTRQEAEDKLAEMEGKK